MARTICFSLRGVLQTYPLPSWGPLGAAWPKTSRSGSREGYTLDYDLHQILAWVAEICQHQQAELSQSQGASPLRVP